MRNTFRVVLMTVCAVVGGGLGYVLSSGSALMALAAAVGGALVGGGLAAVPSLLIDRRLRTKGDHGEAAVVDRWSTGMTLPGLLTPRRQYKVMVELRLPDGTHRKAHATQWLQQQEFAALIPGRRVRVHFHLRHPDRVLVDTDHLVPSESTDA